MNPRIQSVFSTDGGATWGELTTLSEAGFSASAPTIISDGTRVSAAWSLNVNYKGRIQVSSFIYGDGVWSTPLTISADTGDAGAPQLASDGANITAVWHFNNRVNYLAQSAVSADSGATWSAPVTLSESGASGQDASSPVVSNGTTINVIWRRSDGVSNRVQVSSFTRAPIVEPTPEPTVEPTPEPTTEPTTEPTVEPTSPVPATVTPAANVLPQSGPTGVLVALFLGLGLLASGAATAVTARVRRATRS
jgi:hypothetical protein